MKLESMLTTGEIMSGSLQDEIKQLKDEKNAIILAHNYQPKEIQEIAVSLRFIRIMYESC